MPSEAEISQREQDIAVLGQLEFKLLNIFNLGHLLLGKALLIIFLSSFPIQIFNVSNI